MSQAQYSTQEQLENLRGVYELGCALEESFTVARLIHLANSYGWYDAADHVQRMAETGCTDLYKLMEW